MPGQWWGGRAQVAGGHACGMPALHTTAGAAGFTLVEILVATLLMAVALIVIASIFPLGWLSQRKAEYLATASGIVQSEIDSRRGSKFNEMPVGTTTGSDGRLPEGNTVTVEVALFPTSGDLDLKSVRVAVAWPGGAVPWLGGRVECETLIGNQ